MNFFRQIILSLCVGLSEFLRLQAESFVVLREQISNFSFKRVICIWVLQQSDNTLNDELGVECWYPVVFDCLCTNLTGVLLYVWVVDLGLEQYLSKNQTKCRRSYFWALEWVVVLKVHIHYEFASFIWCITLHSISQNSLSKQ